MHPYASIMHPLCTHNVYPLCSDICIVSIYIYVCALEHSVCRGNASVCIALHPHASIMKYYESVCMHGSTSICTLMRHYASGCIRLHLFAPAFGGSELPGLLLGGFAFGIYSFCFSDFGAYVVRTGSTLLTQCDNLAISVQKQISKMFNNTWQNQH